MPLEYTPTLTVTTKNLDDMVEIRIKDNGPGIPEEVQAEIFDPFFTTKSSGEGSGLGLYISYEIIVKEHQNSWCLAQIYILSTFNSRKSAFFLQKKCHNLA